MSKIDWDGMTGKGTPNSGRLWWGWGTVEGFLQHRKSKDDSAYLIVPKTVAQLELRPSRVALSSLPARLQSICTDDKFERALHSRGRDVVDILETASGKIENPVDLVAFPQTEDDILALFAFCGEQHIACIPFGGGSSVAWGVNPPPDDHGFSGTITVDMIKFDKVLEVDKVSKSARIQGGVYGPSVEKQLKQHGLTLRYFPQSFEFSTFGGWLATRGGGHFATGPTHIDDMVESLRVVSPKGTTETLRLPASGAGPAEYRQYLGSEGIYGIITEGWVRVRDRPSYRASATILFEADDPLAAYLKGAEAVRNVAQSGLLPSNLRLVDGREVGTTTGREGLENKAVLLLGFESAMKENLDDEMDFAVEQLVAAGGVLDTPKGSSWTKSSAQGNRSGIAGEWGKGFMAGGYTFSEAVLMGVLVNTLETAIPWDRFPKFYQAMNSKFEEVVSKVCGGGRMTCRITHVYADGPAPYFTIIANGTTQPEDLRKEQWLKIKAALTEVMVEHGATSTHHHAVGKVHAAHFAKERGAMFEDSLRALKQMHDPKGILNPDVLIKHQTNRSNL